MALKVSVIFLDECPVSDALLMRVRPSSVTYLMLARFAVIQGCIKLPLCLDNIADSSCWTQFFMACIWRSKSNKMRWDCITPEELPSIYLRIDTAIVSQLDGSRHEFLPIPGGEDATGLIELRQFPRISTRRRPETRREIASRSSSGHSLQDI
ncbi:hypothetical protein C4D60_Mb06t24730 [Musa balbisiana]|uniref:Uncharacterized protein n=1 Tax=Musa balbisiana TaxID=52838 RepID=A0A4S8IQJ6_MUSBA|nr:hypothetical protein C4D60_Mb06t24730 [Musa balbisiana]